MTARSAQRRARIATAQHIINKHLTSAASPSDRRFALDVLDALTSITYPKGS